MSGGRNERPHAAPHGSADACALLRLRHLGLALCRPPALGRRARAGARDSAPPGRQRRLFLREALVNLAVMDAAERAQDLRIGRAPDESLPVALRLFPK